MKKNIIVYIALILIVIISGCSGTKAISRITDNPRNTESGQPSGTVKQTDPSAVPTGETSAPPGTSQVTPATQSPEKVTPGQQIFTYWTNFPEKGPETNLTAYKFVVSKIDHGLKVEAFNKDNTLKKDATINVFNSWLCSYTLKDPSGKIISSGNSSANYTYFQIIAAISGGIESTISSGTFKGYYKDYEGSNTVIAAADAEFNITADIIFNWSFSAEYSSLPKSKGFSVQDINTGRKLFKYDIKAGTEMFRDEFENIHLVAVPANTINDGVPTILINTKNDRDVADKINLVPGTYAMVEGTKKQYNTKNQKGYLSIKGRGNTSWGMEKKPYSIELVQPAGLLGMPDNKDWELIANHSDKTLMRNYITYQTASLMNGFGYSPRNRFVEVYLNNEFRGLYLLVEKVEAAKDKINIKETKKGDDLSNIMNGSFVIELESIDRFNSMDQRFWQSVQTAIGTMNIKSPGNSDLIRESKLTVNWDDPNDNLDPLSYFDPNYQYKDPMKRYIRDYIDKTNAAIRSIRNGNYNSYKKYIDTKSFIDFIIMQELTKNIDGSMKCSIYFYKDKGGKMYIGPVWDFDIAYGNCNYSNGPGQPDAWTTDGFMLKDATWFKDLMKDPQFKKDLIARYKELKSNQFNKMYSLIDTTGNYIKRAAESNFDEFPVLDYEIWPNPPEIVEANTFDKQCDFLKNWIRNRIRWLDTDWH